MPPKKSTYLKSYNGQTKCIFGWTYKNWIHLINGCIFLFKMMSY